MTSLRASVTASLLTLTACLGAVACSGFDGGGGAGGGVMGSSVTSSSSASSSSSSSGGPSVVFSEVQPIFVNSCTYGDCHSTTSRKAGLDLSATQAFDKLVNVESLQCDDGRKRVEPGQPDKSYLIDKLKGMRLCFGERMPAGDGPMKAADLKKITDWVASGAREN
jgi:hypothetical protein